MDLIKCEAWKFDMQKFAFYPKSNPISFNTIASWEPMYLLLQVIWYYKAVW